MAACHGNICGRAFVSLLRWIETENSTLKGFAGRCRCYRIERLRTLSEWMIWNIEQNPNPRSYIMTKEEVNFNRQMPASHQWILKTEGASRAQISHRGSQWWRTNCVRRDKGHGSRKCFCLSVNCTEWQSCDLFDVASHRNGAKHFQERFEDLVQLAIKGKRLMAWRQRYERKRPGKQDQSR